ncbi:rCG41320 [Rattus norvegicus]|uniref:RCG41320 n=1 Tax=Rattus norvegicus TaxID=10116 RepID=A6IHB6_RAT|nr:rCG41320 [Rattus norvegicus]
MFCLHLYLSTTRMPGTHTGHQIPLKMKLWMVVSCHVGLTLCERLNLKMMDYLATFKASKRTSRDICIIVCFQPHLQ